MEVPAYSLLCILLLVMYLRKIASVENKKAIFTFPDFPYKESNKNEMAFREYESACEQSPLCEHVTGVTQARCIRECISPSCYNDIYRADPLEEGEIDVRLNSFKGCFIQRSGRPRS